MKKTLISIILLTLIVSVSSPPQTEAGWLSNIFGKKETKIEQINKQNNTVNQQVSNTVGDTNVSGDTNTVNIPDEQKSYILNFKDLDNFFTPQQKRSNELSEQELETLKTFIKNTTFEKSTEIINTTIKENSVNINKSLTDGTEKLNNTLKENKPLLLDISTQAFIQSLRQDLVSPLTAIGTQLSLNNTALINALTSMPFPTGGGGGSGTTLTSASITQTAHGFAIGDVIYQTATVNVYALASSTSSTTSEWVGVVQTIPTANTFTYSTAGLVNIPTTSAGNIGSVAFLSTIGTTGNTVTFTEPTGVSNVSKPVYVVVSTTTALLENFRATPVAGTTAVVQYGENNTITDGQTTTSTTFVDVTNGSFTLPSAGTYKIEYYISTANQSGSSNVAFLISDSSNVVVQGSQSNNQNFTAAARTAVSQSATIITTSAATYKLRWATQSGTQTIYNIGTTGSNMIFGNSKITWTQIGASPVPMDLVGENGISYATGSVTPSAAETTPATAVDVPGMTVTLPTAGKYLIYTTVRGSLINVTNTNRALEFALFDSSNALYANSEAMVSFFNNNLAVTDFDIQSAGSSTYSVTVASATTIKVKVWNSSATAGATTNSDLNGRSSIAFTKISGFMPSSGQTVDFVNARAAVAQSVTTTDQVITLDTVDSGNIPLSNNAFTLSAGKTYNLSYILPLGNATNIEYRWFNVTTGLYFGNSGKSSNSSEGETTVANAIIIPSVTTQVRVQAVFVSTGGTIGFVSGNRVLTSNVVITQLGSSAVIAGVYPGTWTSYTPTITATAAGTNPTLPTSATITGSYTVQGKVMLLNVRYSALAITGGTAGTQSYAFSIPGGYTIDTTKATLPSDVTNTSLSGFDGSTVGTGFARNSANTGAATVVPVSTTGLGLFTESNVRLIGSGAFALNGAANTSISFTAQVPIN